MPNHITNRLTIKTQSSEKLTEVLDFIKGIDEDEKSSALIDFNKIKPMPAELEGTSSPVRIISKEAYEEQEKRLATGELTDIEKFAGVSKGITQEMSNQYKKDFGADNWYDWHIANWGTKWNAYDYSQKSENVIEFDTAWSTPYDVMVTLSEKFPDVEFFIEYADEDFGYNVGSYTLENGEETDSFQPDGGTLEALELAMDLQDRDYYLSADNFESDELDDYQTNLVQIIHNRGRLDEDYPAVVLNKLKELAVEDKQFERAGEIDKLLAQTEPQK